MSVTEITFTQSELDEFAARLAAVVAEFTAEEQMLLEALVGRGIEQVREEASDVEGFLLPAVRNLPAVQLVAHDGSVRAGDGSVLKMVGDPHANRGIIAVLKIGV